MSANSGVSGKESKSGSAILRYSSALARYSARVGLRSRLILNHTAAQLEPSTCGTRSNALSISNRSSFLILPEAILPRPLQSM